MKKIFILMLTVVLFPSFIVAQVKGNVFWKYNDFIGNKADAGSKVLLFSVDSTQNINQATTDLQGNFSFDNVKDGDYLIVVISKNVTESAKEKIEKMINYKKPLEKLNLLDYSDAKEDISKYKSIDSLNLIKKISFHDLKNKKIKHKRRLIRQKGKEIQALNKKEGVLLGQIKKEIKHSQDLDLAIYSIDMFSSNDKIYIKRIKVHNNKTAPIVVDFGITYN